MPLSKARNRARMRLERARQVVQPVCNLNTVQPVQPSPQWRPNKYFPTRL
jgi:hypothetical protein